ncbi:hypothetical protein BS17DRAFT_773440, partial [Gyrodon lividus]
QRIWESVSSLPNVHTPVIMTSLSYLTPHMTQTWRTTQSLCLTKTKWQTRTWSSDSDLSRS